MVFMTITTTQTMALELVGNTYQHRDFLRAHGWSWSPAGQCWCKTVRMTRPGMGDCGEADPRLIFARAVSGNRSGCALYEGRALIWASKTSSARREYEGDASAIRAAADALHEL